MPQQVESKVSTLQLRDQPQRLDRRVDGAERLLVAMAVQQRALARHRRERQVETAGLALGGDELLEQLGALAASALVSASGQHRREFVAQGQQAGRFETDDRGAGGDRRRQRVEHAARLLARLVDQAGAEKGAAAAQRPADGRLRGRDAIAGAGQHPLGGARRFPARNSG